MFDQNKVERKNEVTGKYLKFMSVIPAKVILSVGIVTRLAFSESSACRNEKCGNYLLSSHVEIVFLFIIEFPNGGVVIDHSDV